MAVEADEWIVWQFCGFSGLKALDWVVIASLAVKDLFSMVVVWVLQWKHIRHGELESCSAHICFFVMISSGPSLCVAYILNDRQSSTVAIDHGGQQC